MKNQVKGVGFYPNHQRFNRMEISVDNVMCGLILL